VSENASPASSQSFYFIRHTDIPLPTSIESRCSSATSILLESPRCCTNVMTDRYDECELGTVEYFSAEPYCGRPRPELTQSVTVERFVMRDMFYRDPCDRQWNRLPRPSCCDLSDEARVCIRVPRIGVNLCHALGLY
jgi:hypothetical protein